MQKESVGVIEGRFEAVIHPLKIEIFKIVRPATPERAVSIPLTALMVDESKSECRGCLIALGWLRDNRYISSLEYFREAEKLLVKAFEQHRSHTGRK